jgi:hypothetical protein
MLVRFKFNRQLSAVLATLVVAFLLSAIAIAPFHNHDSKPAHTCAVCQIEHLPSLVSSGTISLDQPLLAAPLELPDDARVYQAESYRYRPARAPPV